MNDELRKQIADEANKWVEPGNDNRSQRKLAKKIGVSEATLSNIRKGKWESISDSLWNKLAAFFHQLGVIKHEGDDVWRFFEYVPEVEMVQDVLANAKRYQRRAAIDGPTGKGKTEAIRHWVNRDRSNECFHILCSKSMNPKTFCVNIAETIGLSQIATNRYQLEQDIAEKILTLANPIVIIDEIENLSRTCFSAIKALIDLTDGQCAWVLSGIELHKLMRDGSSKAFDAFRQLQRRFPVQSYEFLPEGIEFETMKHILKDCGITNHHTAEWFQENVFDYDALKNTVKDALRISRKHKKEITREFMAHFFTPKRRLSYSKDFKRAA
jgi:DNA transposition AAA+ family ATPase